VLSHPIDVLFDRLEQLAFLNHPLLDHVNDFFVHVQLMLEIHLIKQDDRDEYIDAVILFPPIVVI
jgi:hypothetical protein